MRAMILAAGLGTRLKPFTENHPKALAMVNGKTLLQHNIEYLITAGISDIIINVHHFADQIIDAIATNEQFGKHITISDESMEVLETGGGLQKASWFFDGNEPFLLMNVDILTDLNVRGLIHAHIQSGALATLAVTDRQTSRYFLFTHDNKLCGWENVKTGEVRMCFDTSTPFRKAFSGVHVISPRIFSLITFSGKFSMVDVYLTLAKTETIAAFDHSGSKFIDVGTPGSIEEAEKLFS